MISSDFSEPLQAGDVATLQEQQHALFLILCEFDRVCKLLKIPYFLFAGTLLGAVRHRGFVPWDDDIDVVMTRENYEKFLSEAPDALRPEFFLQGEYSEHWPMFFSKLRLNGTTCLEKFHPKDPKAHSGLFIDIFPCDNAFSREFGRKLQFLCSKVIIAKGLDRRGYETTSMKKKLFMRICRILPRGLFTRVVRGPRSQGAYLHTFFGAASKYSKNVYPSSCFQAVEMLPFESGVFPVPQEYDRLLTIIYGDYKTLPTEEERKCKQHAVLVDLTKSYETYEHYLDGIQFDVPLRSIR